MNRKMLILVCLAFAVGFAIAFYCDRKDRSEAAKQPGTNALQTNNVGTLMDIYYPPGAMKR